MAAAVSAWSPLRAAGLSLPGPLAERLDTELQTDLAAAAGLTLFYFLAVGVLRPASDRPRAWLITAFSTLTCAACFFVAWLVLDELPALPIHDPAVVLMDTPFSRFASRYFRVTLVVDLLLGVLFYRKQMDPLTTYFHHTAYFALLTWAINARVTLCFMLFLVEEIPTFLLALGSIDRRLRHDLLFGGSWLVLRIVYHSVPFYTVFWLWNRAGFEDPVMLDVIRGNLALTMALHLHWFSGWIRQQLRLRRKAAAAVAAAAKQE
eukprot:jgi/Tetstr1/458181/TSEL_044672.t1